jgi:hypothetical protein
MSIDEDRAAGLQRAQKENADNDPMLQAYGRYWLPVVTRLIEVLEKIERHLAARNGENDAK